MHLNGIFFRKVEFFITAKAKGIILSSYDQPKETMAINKFQRSSLTVHLQPRSLIVESQQYI